MKTTKLKLFSAALGIAAIGLFSVACHPHHGGPHNPERMLKHFDSMADKLDLNESQKVQYKELRSNMEKELQARKEKHKEFMRSIKEELNKQEPDVDKIAELAKKKMNERSQDGNPMIGNMVQFYKILNAEQKSQVLEKARSHFDRFDED